MMVPKVRKLSPDAENYRKSLIALEEHVRTVYEKEEKITSEEDTFVKWVES